MEKVGGPRLDHKSHGHTGTCPRQSFQDGLESLQEDEGSAPGSPTSNLGPLAREVALAFTPKLGRRDGSQSILGYIVRP